VSTAVHTAPGGTPPAVVPAPSRQPAQVLRAAFALLAAVGVVGTGLELGMLRHWESPTQLIPFAALTGLAVATGLATFARGHAAVSIVRALALVVGACGVYGVVVHVQANLSAGPLDARYATTWDSMSTLSQWWAALTETVGPAPVLAPLILTQTALFVVLATVGRVDRTAA
jgi:hypothetical protein